jgi:streptogramin lyase
VNTPLSLPLGLKIASNGLLYVSLFNANKILEFNPKTKTQKTYTLPLPLQYPAVMRAEVKGWIYFSLFTGNGIGRLNLKTKKIELYPTNQNPGLGSVITQDSQNGVWLSFFTTNVMARLNTNTFNYRYVPFPGTFAQGGLPGLFGDVPPYVDISVNYGPGDAIWFGSITKNQVGRYSLS